MHFPFDQDNRIRIYHLPIQTMTAVHLVLYNYRISLLWALRELFVELKGFLYGNLRLCLEHSQDFLSVPMMLL